MSTWIVSPHFNLQMRKVLSISVIANLLFYPFSCHLTQFHGVDTESKNSIAEHVRWDYNLSLCGGCRSTERLYFLIYCNPHLFCFFKRNTALRSLSNYTALGRTVAKCSCPAPKCFLYLFAFCHFWIAVTLLVLPLTKCSKTQPHLISSLLDSQLALVILQHSALLQCKTQSRSCLWLNWGTGSAGYIHLTLLETCTAQRKKVIHLVSSDKPWVNG